MYKANFKTAYLQREIPVNVAVIGSTALEVGQLVTFTAANGSNPAYITAAAGTSESAALTNATHIIAQSDMTMEYGHVLVENRDYSYSPKVAATATSIGASATTKKVALFKLVNKDDVVTYTV